MTKPFGPSAGAFGVKSINPACLSLHSVWARLFPLRQNDDLADGVVIFHAPAPRFRDEVICSYAEYTCVPAMQVQTVKTELPWEILGAPSPRCCKRLGVRLFIYENRCLRPALSGHFSGGFVGEKL